LHLCIRKATRGNNNCLETTNCTLEDGQLRLYIRKATRSNSSCLETTTCIPEDGQLHLCIRKEPAAAAVALKQQLVHLKMANYVVCIRQKEREQSKPHVDGKSNSKVRMTVPIETKPRVVKD
jgi:hypothetical protein